MKSDSKLRLLLEMRPALDGFAGIPQETRLLFRGLCLIDSVEVEGLLQTSLKFLAPGMDVKRNIDDTRAESVRLNRYSRVIISLDATLSKAKIDVIFRFLKRQRVIYALFFSTVLFRGRKKIETSIFESRYFESYIWQALFAKTLHSDDFGLVTDRNFRVCTVPWNVMQSVGLDLRKFGSKPIYPVLSTPDTDILIAQTPYPARVGKHTALVVRYHDALPVFMPHAFANKSRHQATHFHALECNVRSGAYFACVSESARRDLVRIFPEAEDRAVTIHNMVSHQFYEEDSSPARVCQIIRSRSNVQLKAVSGQNKLTDPNFFCEQRSEQLSFKYLLMVGTIEPRKNHSRLISAFEYIHAEVDPSIKLVVVGSMGWDVEPVIAEMRTWIDRGQLFVLNNVPAADLRVLYRHAAVTICPSLAEGFDFSGVECMRSGGIVIASDIPVHREVYAEAAEYFDPYSSQSLASVINKVLYEPDAVQLRTALRVSGENVSLRYLPDAILPQWGAFLNRVAGAKGAGIPCEVGGV